MNTILPGVLQILVAVLNGLWQGALVTALVWVVLRFSTRINAATRYVIWWAVMAVVLVLPAAPLMTRVLPTRAQRAPIVTQEGRVQAPRAASPSFPKPAAIVTLNQEPSARWPLWIAALWAAVFLFRMIQITRSYFYLRGIKRRAQVSEVPLPAIQRRARLLFSNEIASPMAVGFLRPAVIVPESLPDQLEKPEMDHVLLHEAAHIARLDDWTNLMLRLLGAALALHPVAMWILRQIEREREIACDDWVVARTGEARHYAASLARMFELRWSRRRDLLASGLFGNGSRMGDRIEMLLRRGPEFPPRASPKRVAASFVALLALVVVGSFTPRWIAFAQTPSFEVASIKPNRSGEGVSSVHVSAGRLRMENVPLKKVTLWAYDIPDDRDYALAGPDWLGTERFDIQATMPADTPMAKVRQMMQTVLSERFKLAFHHEARTMQIYALTVGKGAPKIGPVEEGESRTSRGTGKLEATKTSMPKLADLLGRMIRRPVEDRTGLKGVFDFTLEWSEGPEGVLSPGATGPSLLTALQEQLGVKLESTKGPVEVIVVDHVERPSAN